MITDTDVGSIEVNYSRDDWPSVFAQRLMEENFLLTALEFHTELVEAGRELPKLKQFFSNPGNFEQHSLGRQDVTLPRSLSQGTLDSLDLARYSEDGERGCDEKVAVLEFELRKAKETISALRANLTDAATATDSNATTSNVTPDNSNSNIATPQQAPIKPHEKRAINFSINEYLLHHGYKLTSITFADENESQDFEDWNDVGLNTPRPHELLHIYREGLHSCKKSEVFCCSTESQTDIEEAIDEQNDLIPQLREELQRLQAAVTDLEREKAELLSRLSAVPDVHEGADHEESTSPDMFEMIECSSETKSVQSNEWSKVSESAKEIIEQALESCNLEDKEVAIDEEVRTDSPSMEMKVDTEKFAEDVEDLQLHSDNQEMRGAIPRSIPEGFKREILKHCNIGNGVSDDILKELIKDVDLSDITTTHMVSIQSSYLQKIIPNIILNKREEVIPLLVLTICLCENAQERDQLLNLLYNLKKKPQAEERQQILKALLAVAKTLGPSFTEEELLPQCWEQIGHKYLERRLLVAQACCILLPFVSEMIRNSLILSMVQQLTQDREDEVRLCSVHCLTVLITCTSVADKYSQICDLSVTLLADPSSTVTQMVLTVLLPVVAQWSCELRLLQTHLLDRLLKCLTRAPSTAVMSALQALLPYLVMFIASSPTVASRIGEPHPKASKRQEFASLCKGLYDPMVFFGSSVGSMVSAFDHLTVNLEECSDWPELHWVLNDMLPVLLKVAEDNWNQKTILHQVALLTRHLCAGIGRNVTYNLIKPELSRRLEMCSSGLIAGEVRNLEMIPIYLIGVLSLGEKDGAGHQQVGGTLLEFLCGLPLCGAPLLPLQIAIESLFAMETHRVVVLDTLWEGVLHQRPLVRSAAATLFQSVASDAPDDLVATRIVPALVTLASDPELSVKLAVIPTLGAFGDTNDAQTRAKVTMTLQALLTEAVSCRIEPVLLQLTATIAEYWEKFEPAFCDDVILPQLSLMTASCSEADCVELVKALTETFSAIVFSSNQISDNSLASCVIPSLRHLESNCRQLDLPHGERVESLLRQAERLLPSTPNTSSEMNVTSPTARVEHVKNRVTKMFNTRPQSLSVSGIFKKKP